MNRKDLLQRHKELQAAIQKREEENVLKRLTFLPSQQKVIDAYHDPNVHITIFTGPNQVGKTHTLCANLSADLKGYQPWDGRPRQHQPPIRAAVLLRDYDNHSRNMWMKLSELNKSVKIIDSTQQRAPRVIQDTETGSTAHVFTHDQDVDRLEGGTYHVLYVDEPCPQVHFNALRRGLSKWGGKVLMFMTPLSAPWIFDEYYQQASNLGGEKKEVFAVTAFPEENLKSHGGYLDDKTVQEFWESLSEEEREARKHGRWMHLIGRVYKSFDPKVHVLEEPPCSLDDCCIGIAVDPHDRLPFAIAWFAVTPGDDIVFYDEWPRTPFEEMKQCDKTVQDYAELILQERTPTWRVMDPNYGRRRSLSSGLSIADEFQLRGLAFDTSVTDDLAAGHKRVQEYLAWDREKPLDHTNQPKLYFLRRCRNLIKGFQNYVWDDWKGKIAEGKAAKQKPKEAFKHFPDCVRYAIMSRVRHIRPSDYSERPEIPQLRSAWQEERTSHILLDAVKQGAEAVRSRRRNSLGL